MVSWQCGFVHGLGCVMGLTDEALGDDMVFCARFRLMLGGEAGLGTGRTSTAAGTFRTRGLHVPSIRQSTLGAKQKGGWVD